MTAPQQCSAARAPSAGPDIPKQLAGVVEANRSKIERETRRHRAAAELTAETANEFEDKPDEEAGEAA